MSEHNNSEDEVSHSDNFSLKRKQRVLIVNDEAMQLMCLSLLFKKNFVVHTADNGYQAFERIKETCNKLDDVYDLIVLDLHMPI